MKVLNLIIVLFLGILEVFTQSIIQNKNILPYTVFPLNYDVTLTPNFENGSNFTFEGSLTMDFKPAKHYIYSSVVVHMDNISVLSVSVSSFSNNGSKSEEDVVSTEYDPDSQWYNVTISEPFIVDNVYRLTIAYTGVITNDRRGLYRSSYVDPEGNTRWYALTQLRPVFSRRLLPCLDEPRYKATFRMRVWILPQYTALSNMPVETISEMDQSTGRVLVTFQETLRMSPFLLALAIFDFASLTSSDHAYSTWALPSKIRDAELAQEMAPKVVSAMEKFAGSQFPLPKMDQIAVPDLEPVAMENWGMNTYREMNILYEVGRSLPRQMTNVPRFTAHEVSHYWMGNSVTVAWWDWLWMSEGFAMYLEYYLPNQVEPRWRMLDQVITDLVLPGLLGDSLPSSVPLTTHVETRSEVIAKFSGLTYTKGPALIRMVEHFLTSAKFKEAFKNLFYMKALNTVNPKVFWSFFDAQGIKQRLPESVTNIMSSWTDKPGYPLVTVTRNYETGNIRLIQRRFLQDGQSTGSNDTLWWVPLSYTTKTLKNFNNTRAKDWLSDKINSKEIHLNTATTDWIIFNLQLTGFYRVNYDPTNWNLLIKELKTVKTRIHVLNRAQLIDDSLQLARSKLLPYSIALDLLTYLKFETDYIPWSSAFNGLDFLERRLTGYPLIQKFRDFVKGIVTPLYQNVGYEELNSDSHVKKLVRIPAVSWACSHGLEHCTNKATQELNSLMSGNTFRVSPGLEAITLCTAVENGGRKEWEFVKNISITGAMNALACSRDQSIIISYLSSSLATDSETVWSQRFTSVFARPNNINTAFNVLLNNLESLKKRFGFENVKKYINQIGDFLTTTQQRDKLKDILLKQESQGVQDAITAVVNSLDKNLAWMAGVYPTIEQWLAN